MQLFNKQAMGDNAWETIALQGKQKLTKRIAHSKEALPLDDEPEDEFSESIREQVHVLERQLVFMEFMHRLSFHPGIVPADGNCALWTVLALDGGAFAKAQWANKHHVQQMRIESCIYYCFQVFGTTFLLSSGAVLQNACSARLGNLGTARVLARGQARSMVAEHLHGCWASI